MVVGREMIKPFLIRTYLVQDNSHKINMNMKMYSDNTYEMKVYKDKELQLVETYKDEWEAIKNFYQKQTDFIGKILVGFQRDSKLSITVKN